MRYKVIRPFTDDIGGKDGAGKGVVYNPNIPGINTFPAEGVDVSPKRIAELASSQNKLVYAVIQAEEPVEAAETPTGKEPANTKADKKTK